MEVTQSSRGRWLLRLAGLVAIVAALYVFRLGTAPIRVHYDEVFIALEAQSIAETGRDGNGRLFPVYFNIGYNVWYQPIAIYFSALFLKVLPLSDASIRLSTVAVALANVILIYFVAWRMFQREAWALLTAALLALTPAHLIHSRVAVDYLYPLPFVLTWALLLLKYLQERRLSLLFGAGTSLGIGFYTYIASVVMMPIYLAITLGFLLWERASWRSHAAAVAGFAWPLLLIPPFLLAHPGILVDFQQRYHLGSSNAGMDPLQSMRDSFNSRNITERLNLYYDFFSPGFLFVSGGSNVINSTRESGVFLSSFVVFLAAGFYDALTRPARAKTLAALGFLTAPIAACVVVENYAIDRALALLPFGALLATIGIARLWSAACHLPLSRAAIAVSGALIAAAVLYMSWTLFSRGAISGTPPWMILGALVIAGVGYQTQQTRRWRPVVVLLLALALFQYQYFYRDYLGDYGPRSVAWYGNNIRGAIERAIALDDERPAPKILLTGEIRDLDAYWRFYLIVNDRRELLPKGELFTFDRIDIDTVPADSLLICRVEDVHAPDLVARGDIVAVASVSDPNDRYSPLGPGEHVTFVIYRKVGKSPAGRG